MDSTLLKTTIQFTDAGGTTEQIDGLFETYIRGATDKINKPWVLRALDNGRGIVQFADQSLQLHIDETTVTAKVVARPTDAAPTAHDAANVREGSISAEWHPPAPDASPVTELLPLQTALAKLQSTSAKRASTESGPSLLISDSGYPAYDTLDPYAAGWATVDGAVRQLIARGVNPDKVALAIMTNGQTDRVGALVRCLQGCHDAAVAYRTPLVAHRDDPHALLHIMAVGERPHADSAIPTHFVHGGNALYIVGNTHAEMGATDYALLHGETGGTVAQPLTEGLMRYRSLFRAMREGLVTSCRAITHGGLLVTLAQTMAASGLGATLQLGDVPGTIAHDALLLFSESIGRFLVEVTPANEQAFKFQLTAEPHAKIGAVATTATLHIVGYDGDVVLEHVGD